MIGTVIISLIFFTLGILHFNWLFGGTFGLEASLPTDEKGKRVLNPKKIDTIIVGLALITFGIFYLVKGQLINFQLPEIVLSYGSWIIPSIFLVRAIGEFKYVGFFKKIKNTTFAKADTKLFSPLCLIISMLGFLLNL